MVTQLGKVWLAHHRFSNVLISLIISGVIMTSAESREQHWVGVTYALCGFLSFFAVCNLKCRVLSSSAFVVFALIFIGNVFSHFFSEPISWLKVLHPLFWGFVAAALAGIFSCRPSIAVCTAWLQLIAPAALFVFNSCSDVQFGIEQASDFRGGQRFMGFSSEPAHLAQSIAIAWGCLMYCESIRIGSWIAGFAIGVVLLVASKSLTAVPLILLGCFLALYVSWAAKRRLQSAIFLLVLLLGCVWMIAGSDFAIKDRIMQLSRNVVDGSSSDQSAFSRIGATLDCFWDWVQGNPWVPAGTPKVDELGASYSPSGNMHFGPLVIAVACGVPGLLIFLWMCVAGISADWKIGVCLVAAFMLSGRVVTPEGAVVLGLLQSLGWRTYISRRSSEFAGLQRIYISENMTCP